MCDPQTREGHIRRPLGQPGTAAGFYLNKAYDFERPQSLRLWSYFCGHKQLNQGFILTGEGEKEGI
jgi:hypothetical protein